MKRRNQESRLAVRYIDDTIVLSDTHAWTYMRIPTVPFEFLHDNSRRVLAEKIQLALSALATGMDPIDCHLIVTSRPVNPNVWANLLEERVSGWHPAPGWNNYLQAMADHLMDADYLTKQVYLGICVGPRKGKGAAKNENAADFFAPFKKLVGKAEQALALEDDVVSANEISHFHRRANEVRRSLAQSHVAAVSADADTVAWLIAKSLHPDMEVPDPNPSGNTRPWGPGELQILTEGLVRNGHKDLEIEQIDPYTGAPLTGYLATLCVSRFPDVLYFPDQEPWMHYASLLAYPVDLFSRFLIVPAQRVKKDISRKLADAKDQAQHIAETGSMIPLDVQEQYQRATELEFTIARDRQPWIYGRHRLRVTAPSRELLHNRVRKIVEHYRDLGVDISWPSGDQFNLLLEAMPGDRTRAKAYFQRQEISVIAGGMPTASSECGDRVVDGKGWVGPYIGETTSRVRSAVHFSPHVAMAKNYPPGIAVTGAPGGGKSFFAFTLAYQMAMQGVWTIYIDPKADAKPMGELAGLGQPKVFDLREGNDGMLDPFTLADTAPEAKLLALETIRLLLGGHMDAEREEALIHAVETVSVEPNPSLGRVVDLLLTSQSVAARNLGSVLNTMRELPFARLCFAARGGDRMRPEDGLTVITLLGLDLPNADMQPADYSYENRLAVSVMYLLTRYARRLMLSMDKSQPKAICVDEAWAITSTPQGAKLIPEIARMGRSHNTALVLVSQNAGDLMKESVTNSISSVFSFRSTIPDEIDQVLTLLGAEINEDHRSAVRDLHNGECLMKDLEGRLARVQISDWNTELFNAFNTNPETRGKNTDAA